MASVARRAFWLSFKLALLAGLATLAWAIVAGSVFRFPSEPPDPALAANAPSKVRPVPFGPGSFATLSRSVSRSEAERLELTPEGKALLEPGVGAVRVDEALIEEGRRAYHLGTFGNERVLTDVVGLVDGPMGLIALARAIFALRGAPTSDLEVVLDSDAIVGDRMFRKGERVRTGLDVPAGALVPLGLVLDAKGGIPRVGITCAMCHSTLDARTGELVEGAPNSDLRVGFLLALASNSAAFLRNTGVDPKAMPDGRRRYLRETGATALLADTHALERAVDRDLLAWPPGAFDSTFDGVNDPAQIPTAYTFGAFPYGWTGSAALGWFEGLASLVNNAHGANADPTAVDAGMPAVLGVDRETYLGLVLQNAPARGMRLPDGVKPSTFLGESDPTPGEPGIVELVRMPGFPRGSTFVPGGLMTGKPEEPVGRQANAMAAYMNTLAPPPAPEADALLLARGRNVFLKAGCASCHAGERFTNNTVIPLDSVGTHPARAGALASLATTFGDPLAWPPDVLAPVPGGAEPLPVPASKEQERNITLAYAGEAGSAGTARARGRGGYKVPSLLGLAVSAPYLHDGGVGATAPAIEREVGPGTIRPGWWRVAKPNELGYAAGTPDPSASLRLLLDRRLRAPAVEANRATRARTINGDGSGHAFWVDSAAGFAPSEQEALVAYLLSLDDDPLLARDTLGGLSRVRK